MNTSLILGIKSATKAYLGMQDSLSNLWVEGSGLLVFDITDKRAPVYINPMNSGASIYWEMSEDQFRECVAVRPSDAFSQLSFEVAVLRI